MKHDQSLAELALDLQQQAGHRPGNCYVATPDAAAYLGLSNSFLEKARLVGNGPAYVRFGRAIRYSVAALDAWAAECTARPAAQDPDGEAEGSDR